MKTPALWAAVGACLVALGSLALFVRDHNYSLYDDAYIYLRYVKNMRAGCGLRFNCSDPPVEGFTSPLYFALLVLGSHVTPRLVTLTQVLGTASIAGTLVLAAKAAYDSVSGPIPPSVRAAASASVVLVLGLDHHVLLNAVIGLETGLAALWLLGLYLAWVHERTKTAIALAAFAALVRPEAIVFAFLLPVILGKRRMPSMVPVIAVLAAFAAVRFALFHDFVPNTAWAKAGGSTRHIELGLHYVYHTLLEFPLVLAAPLALVAPARRRLASYILSGAALWVFGVIYAGGDTFEYGRLLFPLVPLLAVLACSGLVAVGTRFAAFSSWPSAFALLPSAACATLAVAHALPPMHGFDNVALWSAIGKTLKVTARDKQLATVPIGAIAYYSELEVLDMVGLTSREIAHAGRGVPPELLEQKWIGHERHNLEWVLARKPDIVVTTKFGTTPYRTITDASAGFYADLMLLRAIKSGVAPYHVGDLALGTTASGDTLHVLLYLRNDAP